MRFAVSTWFYIDTIIMFLMLFILAICFVYFIGRLFFDFRNLDKIFVLMFTIFIIYMGVLEYYHISIPTFGVTDKEYTFKIKDDKNNNSELLNYFKLNSVKNDINNTYNIDYEEICKNDTIPNYKYDYDYITISVSLSEEEVTFSQFFWYILNKQTEEIYICNEKLHAITEPLSLDGKLEKKIEDGEIRYSINGYTLYPNDKLSSLNLNNNIKLDIIYNKEKYNDDKIITDYKIINANNY